jgi:hypothetical protein
MQRQRTQAPQQAAKAPIGDNAQRSAQSSFLAILSLTAKRPSDYTPPLAGGHRLSADESAYV